MPKFAVLVKYELISGLLVDADNEDEAARLAERFEGALIDLNDISEFSAIEVVSRESSDGTLELDEVADVDEARELIEEWIEEDDDDLDDEDDDLDDTDLVDEDELADDDFDDLEDEDLDDDELDDDGDDDSRDDRQHAAPARG